MWKRRCSFVFCLVWFGLSLFLAIKWMNKFNSSFEHRLRLPERKLILIISKDELNLYAN